MRSGFGDGGCGLPHQCAHWLRNDSFLHGVWCMAGGRPQGSPLRITSKSLLRADVGIGPYGGETEIRPLSGGRGRTPPLRKRYKGRGTRRNPPVTASPCQPPLGKGAKGTGDADCHSQCAHWLRNDIFFAWSVVHGRRATARVAPTGWCAPYAADAKTGRHRRGCLPGGRLILYASILRLVRYFFTIRATLKVIASSNSRRSRPVSFLIFSRR